MPTYKQPQSVSAPKDKTVSNQTGGTRSLGVKDAALKALGRNRAKIANQTGRSK